MIFFGVFMGSEPEIVSYKWNGRSEYRKLITFDRAVFLRKIDRIGILSSGQVVYAQAPGIMGDLLHFVIAFNIHRKIGAEIIGYPVLVPVGIINAL